MTWGGRAKVRGPPVSPLSPENSLCFSGKQVRQRLTYSGFHLIVEKNKSPLCHQADGTITSLLTSTSEKQGSPFLPGILMLWLTRPDARHLEASRSPPLDPSSTWYLSYDRLTVRSPTSISISCRIVVTRAGMGRMKENRERMNSGYRMWLDRKKQVLYSKVMRIDNNCLLQNDRQLNVLNTKKWEQVWGQTGYIRSCLNKQNKNASGCRDPGLAKMLRVRNTKNAALRQYPSNFPSKGQKTLWKRQEEAEDREMGTTQPLWSWIHSSCGHLRWACARLALLTISHRLKRGSWVPSPHC